MLPTSFGGYNDINVDIGLIQMSKDILEWLYWMDINVENRLWIWHMLDLIFDLSWIQMLRMDTNFKGWIQILKDGYKYKRMDTNLDIDWIQMFLKIYSNVDTGWIRMLKIDFKFDTGWIWLLIQAGYEC